MKLEMKSILAGLLLITASGCSSTEPNNKASLAAKDELGYECKYIAEADSRIKKKICTTASYREESTEKGQDFLRHMQIPVGGGNN